MSADDDPAITTRRGFVGALGLSSLSLAGLWAGYGVLMPGGHHGHGGGEGLSVDEFRRRTQEFIDANQLDDGSVKPGLKSEKAHAEEEGHDESENGHTEEEDHENGHTEEEKGHETEDAHGGDEHGAGGHEAVDVYLMAYQWGYSPSTLRLETGVPYRFRMMSIDVIHGLSINIGSRSVMHRLPPGALVEDELVFEEPGEYLVYCSYYCGQGHDKMHGTIIVEDTHE